MHRYFKALIAPGSIVPFYFLLRLGFKQGEAAIAILIVWLGLTLLLAVCGWAESVETAHRNRKNGHRPVKDASSSL
jgi:hypothetical protein